MFLYTFNLHNNNKIIIMVGTKNHIIYFCHKFTTRQEENDFIRYFPSNDEINKIKNITCFYYTLYEVIQVEYN